MSQGFPDLTSKFQRNTILNLLEGVRRHIPHVRRDPPRQDRHRHPPRVLRIERLDEEIRRGLGGPVRADLVTEVLPDRARAGMYAKIGPPVGEATRGVCVAWKRTTVSSVFTSQ